MSTRPLSRRTEDRERIFGPGRQREPTAEEVGLNEPSEDPLTDMDADGEGDADDSIDYNDILEIAGPLLYYPLDLPLRSVCVRARSVQCVCEDS